MTTHLNVPIQLNGGTSNPIGDDGQSNFQLFDREPYVFQSKDENSAYLYVGKNPDSKEEGTPVPVYTEYADKSGLIEKTGLFKLNAGDEVSDSFISRFKLTVNGLQGQTEKDKVNPSISDFSIYGLKKLVIDINSDICGENFPTNAPQEGQIFFKIIDKEV